MDEFASFMTLLVTVALWGSFALKVMPWLSDSGVNTAVVTFLTTCGLENGFAVLAVIVGQTCSFFALGVAGGRMLVPAP